MTHRGRRPRRGCGVVDGKSPHSGRWGPPDETPPSPPHRTPSAAPPGDPAARPRPHPRHLGRGRPADGRARVARRTVARGRSPARPRSADPDPMLTAGLVWQFLLVADLIAGSSGRSGGRSRRTRSGCSADPPEHRPPRRSGVAARHPADRRAGGRGAGARAAHPRPAASPWSSTRTPARPSSGGWGWLALILAIHIFNTVLGEELLFKGYCCRGWRASSAVDWPANGVLFAPYHLHVPWVIPPAVIDAFLIAYPSSRYRSAWSASSSTAPSPWSSQRSRWPWS